MRLFLRALIAFFILVVIAAAAAWLTETPGEVAIDWRGYRLETSVAVLAVALALLFVIAGILFELIRSTRAIPRKIGQKRAANRREQGYLALTRGMVAIAEGNTVEARRQAKLANDILGRPPGALLIGAQAAQLEGRPEVARKFYDAMAEQQETELLGVRGLLTLAEHQGDTETALKLAERARALNPRAAWAQTRLFHLQVQARRWEAAEATLRDAIKTEAVTTEEGREQDAALLVQLSLMDERTGDRSKALDKARKALRTDPDFLPAALQVVTLQFADGRARQARKTIEDAWGRKPHPDLARLYGQIVGGTESMKRLKAMEKLETLDSNHRETHVAIARAALDAQMWGQARRHLKAAGGEDPDAGICRLFAELEQSENNDVIAARDWLAKAGEAPPEPAWLCDECGATAREWSALCGHCGAFDGLHWRTPPRVTAIADPLSGERTPTSNTELDLSERADEEPPGAPPTLIERQQPTSPGTGTTSGRS